MFIPGVIRADTSENNDAAELKELHPVYELEAIITGDRRVKIDEQIAFSAEQSKLLPEIPAKITWDLGDGTIVEGKAISHAYKLPGRYIVSLRIEQGDKKSSIDSLIFVYEQAQLLLTDETDKQKKIYTTTEQLKKEGTFIHLIENFEQTGESEEVWNRKLNAEKEVWKESKLILIWPQKTVDFGVLTRFFHDNPELDYSDKTFIFITNESLGAVAETAKNLFEIIDPKQIIITSEDVFIPSLLTQKTDQELLAKLDNFLDYRLVNKDSQRLVFFNLVARGVFFMQKKGLPNSTILLILMFPLIATIIAFFRQVLGLPTFGVYTPSILTLSWIVLSLKFGLTIFLIIVISGALIRIFLAKFRMLYIPKVAIILTGSSFIILLTMALGAYYNIADVTTLAVFPMLIMTTIAEKFVSIQSDKGLKSALFYTGSTTLVSLVCYYLVTWEWVRTYALSYPGYMFIAVIITNMIMGRYTGLKLSEYFRFQELFKHMEE